MESMTILPSAYIIGGVYSVGKSYLNLIPFASGALVHEVKHVLAQLGYSVITLQQQLELQQVPARQRSIMVFLCAGRKSCRNGIVAALDKVRSLSRFGLFHREDTDWDRDLIDRFSEFSCWPCHRAELALRLQRLEEMTLPGLDRQTSADNLVHLNLIGRSPLFMQVINRLKKFTRCDAAVLIEGETGTGKELAARAVHYLSARRDHPFVPINCGTLPDNLIENELFGHERGAYTDARDSHPGFIAQAEGGTLFLDEVEALPLKGQVVLLRFLQGQEYRPLGARSARQANVRIIAASNQPLGTLVETGDFRVDLLYRLNIMPVVIPPLRERKDDIDLLAEHFLRSYRVQYNQPSKSLHPDSMQWLLQHHWPGNIRELENLLHREFLLADKELIQFSFLERQANDPVGKKASLAPAQTFTQTFNQAKACAVAAFERQYLCQLLREADGNVTFAARRAGKERRALGRMLKKHGIDRTNYL